MMIRIKNKSIINKILICISPLIIVFFTEYINFNTLSSTFKFIFSNPAVIVFDFIIITFLLFLIMLLTRRFWISFLLIGGFSIGLSIASLIKFTMNDDPLYPWDLAMIKNLGTITSFGTKFYTVTKPMVICVLLFIILTIAFFIMKFELQKGKRRIVCFTGGVLILFLFFTSNIVRNNILPFFGLNESDILKQDLSYYQDNGFIGAFSLNIAHSEVKPAGKYNSDIMNELLSKYNFTEEEKEYLKNTDKFPNIVAILSESFWDARKLNVKYSKNILENFDKAAIKGYKGEMISPVFGGGTIRSEFEFLTGLQSKTFLSGSSPYAQYVDSPTESLASYFKSIGYRTTAIHTFKGDFFERNDGLPYLGFENFISLEDIQNREDYELKGYYTSDDFFIKLIIEELEKNKDDPKFIFGISMQNHQGYAKDKYENYNKDVEVLTDIGEENKEILESYVQGVYDADKALGTLLKYLEKSDRETIVLFFGDHLPTLGPNNQVYVDTGYISKDKNWNIEETKNMFSTPYLIWSNKKDLNNSKNKNNTIGAYVLGEQLLEAANIPKYPVFKFIEEFKTVCHAYNGYLFIDENNVPYNKFQNKKASEFFKNHKIITYDLVIGKKYFSTLFK